MWILFASVSTCQSCKPDFNLILACSSVPAICPAFFVLRQSIVMFTFPDPLVWPHAECCFTMEDQPCESHVRATHSAAVDATMVHPQHTMRSSFSDSQSQSSHQ